MTAAQNDGLARVMAQDVFSADLDGSGARRLFFFGRSGASPCLAVGAGLTSALLCSLL